VGKVMENVHRGPEVSEAVKVGEPTLVDPKQSSAPDLVRAANASVTNVLRDGNSGNRVTVEKIGDGATPAPNAPIPRSDPTPGTTASATPAAAAPDAAPPAADTANAAPGASAPVAGSDMKNDLVPSNNSATSPAPPLPPTQVNDVAGAPSSSSTTAANGTAQQAPPANSDTESTSKKKKKHHLIPLI
jgi:hypothetical protein